MCRKVCFKCKEEKPLERFYAHPQMADGRLNKCKTCAKLDVRRDRRESPKARAYDRKRYRENPKRRELIRNGVKRRNAENPGKYRCRYALSNAVRDGRIKKPDRCSRCGEKAKRIEGHHADYTKPLEVAWLCSLCHRRLESSKSF